MKGQDGVLSQLSFANLEMQHAYIVPEGAGAQQRQHIDEPHSNK